MKQEGAGGNAIKDSVSINGELAGKIANSILVTIEDHLHVRACTLGSTGKKTKEQLSGDIDIAIELEYNKENLELVKEFLTQLYPESEIVDMPGLKICSWGYIYENISDKDTKIVQVDFMFTKNIEYAAFMYHSPNYIKNESNFKGLFRTNLMIICASKTPLNLREYPTVLNEDKEIRDFWKYSWTYNNGLNIVHKTYEGKKKRLKNPKKIEEDTKFITDDIQTILTVVFGNKCTKDDVNSYESIVKYICSPKYVYGNPSQLNLIFKEFFDDVRHQGNEELTKKLINEIKQYGDYI